MPQTKQKTNTLPQRLPAKQNTKQNTSNAIVRKQNVKQNASDASALKQNGKQNIEKNTLHLNKTIIYGPFRKHWRKTKNEN